MSDNEYDKQISLLQDVPDRHAPIKTRIIRGNQAPFMNKDLSNAIMKRSQLKTKYNKTRKESDRDAFKKQRNLCVKLRRKAVKRYFVNKCQSGIMTSKEFWKTVRPFISHKTNTNNCHIILSENNVLVKDRGHVADILNEYFINIAEYTVGRRIPALPRRDMKVQYQKSLINMNITMALRILKRKELIPRSDLKRSLTQK